jgi:hypothetical protein
MSFKHLRLGASCLALAGCNTWNSHIGDEDPYFGEAARYDAAIQTVNPDPVYSADSSKPGDNGEKGAKAVKRYRTDSVKQPVSTGTGGTGSAGGSGTGMSGSSGPG